MANFHLNDVGSVLEITIFNGIVPMNLSQATQLQLQLRKPDGSANILRTAQKVTDGTDGKICYTWIAGDLDMAGTWRLMIYIEAPGFALHSDILRFDIDKNL